jgi:manganese efflux pump family protein
VDVVAILLVALGLAMDAFSVSLCSGMATEKLAPRHVWRMAAFFGGFQMLMPTLGWLGGTAFSRYIGGFDHWIAFGLLAFVGGRMIYESLRGQACATINPANLATLLMLAVATSIDALAVGLSFALLSVSLVVPILVIGAVTFTLSLVGVALGRRVGGFLQSKVAIVGGLILIGIGVRILVGHLLPAIAS